MNKKGRHDFQDQLITYRLGPSIRRISPHENIKKQGGSAGRQLHERIDYRDNVSKSSRIQPTPSETARFYIPWGIFGAKQTACTVILLKVNTFSPTPSPLTTEGGVLLYISVSYPLIRHRYTVAHRLTALYTFSVRDISGIGRIL